MADEHILISGATGAFGRYLVRALMKYPGRFTLLVRGDNDLAAFKRVEKIVGKVDKDKVTVLSCDLINSNLGLSPKCYIDLIKIVTAIFHAAAPTRFDLTLDEARASIFKTTKNITNFSLAARNLNKFGYVSTAYVAGKHTGRILENELTNIGFVNSYDQSKYEAEAYLLSKQNKLPLTIYRPGLIVSPDCGDYNAAVMVLKLIRKGLLPILPGEPTDLVDIISADEASKAIAELFINHFHREEIYHITSGPFAPKLNDVLAIAKQSKRIKYTGHDARAYTSAVKHLTAHIPALREVYRKTDFIIKYLLYPKLFDNSKAEKTLGRSLGKENVLTILEQYLASA